MKTIFACLAILMSLPALAAPMTAEQLTSRVMSKDTITYRGTTSSGLSCSASIRKSSSGLVADVDENSARIPAEAQAKYYSVNAQKHQGDFEMVSEQKKLTLGLTAGRITRISVTTKGFVGDNVYTCANLQVEATATSPTIQGFFGGSHAKTIN